ncbi:2OG-Fe dioxygenase family protein [Oxynema aestuarii]|jgi:hypothetical protein|uniref:2OG-Fe dioxygenase family protein n=1 Tax=Oxynema aestuarii AP17 TaxID=2064643 RepID=A0A6H1U1X9_9CYAN|nr:2OG-Fe dioxygenase family protein [Oxynema aestuarii]QIZ72878.1 hypothetical protein HCG48_21635 [Oxynema aestuarii AP17]
MQTLSGSKIRDSGISFTLQTINSIKLERFKEFFEDLPVDPYYKRMGQRRRLSRFKLADKQLVKLPHGYLNAPEKSNPLRQGMRREFIELDPDLIALASFKRLVTEVADCCQLSPDADIAVHQIRRTCSPHDFGHPSPDGIHRDGADFLAIFAVDRHNVKGGMTLLYLDPYETPVFKKVLYPGELLVVNDRQFRHFTTAIEPLMADRAIVDLFVLTSPSLLSDF